MAITINTQPSAGDYLSAYHVIRVKATSNSVDIVRMRCEIFVDGVSKGSLKQDPDPGTTNEFTFNVAAYVQDQLGLDLDTHVDDYDVNEDVEMLKDVYVKFYEIEEQGDGTLAENATAATGNTFYCINASPDPYTGNVTVTEGKVLGIGATPVFLTEAPTTQSIATDERAFLAVAVDTATKMHRVRVKLYDSSSTLLSTHDITPSSVATGKAYVIPCGPYDLENWSGTISSAISFTSSVSYYTVELIDNAGTPATTSEIRRFDIDSTCYDTSIRIHWLNEWGGIDSHTFHGMITKSQEVESESYSRTQDWRTTPQKRDALTRRIQATEGNTYQLNGEGMAQGEAEWLTSLNSTPLTWYEDTSHVIHGVYVEHIDLDYEVEDEPQYTYDLEVRFNKRKRQRN